MPYDFLASTTGQSESKTHTFVFSAFVTEYVLSRLIATFVPW